MLWITVGAVADPPVIPAVEQRLGPAISGMPAGLLWLSDADGTPENNRTFNRRGDGCAGAVPGGRDSRKRGRRSPCPHRQNAGGQRAEVENSTRSLSVL